MKPIGSIIKKKKTDLEKFEEQEQIKDFHIRKVVNHLKATMPEQHFLDWYGAYLEDTDWAIDVFEETSKAMRGWKYTTDLWGAK